MRLLTAIAALALLAAAPAAHARVPHSFVGTVADGPLLEPSARFQEELDPMVEAGVGSVRLVFDWRDAQPYPDFDSVPDSERSRFRDEGGVPTSWDAIDAHVAGLAARRLRVLPVVLLAPDWAARHPGGRLNSPPSDFAAYARFVGAAVRRYGHGGSFWDERPELPEKPIRDWQLWNEVNFTEFWSDQPFADDYVELLKRGARAVRRADPRARVVLAGFAHRSWRYLGQIYRRGARRYFDVVALHPFTAKSGGTLEIVRRGRRMMRRHGDSRKPLKITELSWTSARGKTRHSFGWDQNERGQAILVRRAYNLLARHRRKFRIESVYWYTWLTADADSVEPFDYAGLSNLRDGSIRRKPAYRAFRSVALRLVGCRAKRARADRCSR